MLGFVMGFIFVVDDSLLSYDLKRFGFGRVMSSNLSLFEAFFLFQADKQHFS